MNDIAPEARAVLTEVYRRMSPSDKWRQIGELYRTARLLHEASFRRDHPAASARDVVNNWMERTIEPELLHRVREEINASDG